MESVFDQVLAIVLPAALFNFTYLILERRVKSNSYLEISVVNVFKD